MEHLSIPGVPHRPIVDRMADAAPGGGTGSTSPEPGSHPEVAEALANRAYFRTESLNNELMSSAETPSELFYGLRGLESLMENGNIPRNLEEKWTPPRELGIMFERANLLKLTPTELERRGWIKGYSPTTGEATPKDRRFASLAITVQEDEDVEKSGVRYKHRYFFGKEPEQGKKGERLVLGEAYDRAVLELEARSIVGEHFGLRDNLRFRDSLEGLTAAIHDGYVPFFKGDHLGALFNMPDVDELVKNPDNKLLGDQVEEAMFLNLVMLNSTTKERMEEFLKKPGSIHLMTKLAKEKAARENLVDYTTEDWIKQNIGRVDEWTLDANRDLKKTWREEKEDGRRGPVTAWSNISAWAGDPAEFGSDKEIAFIEETIGKLVGSSEASWIAATTMRAIGAYASEGYAALPNGKSLLPLGEGRCISGDDTGKFYPYMFNLKEGLKGRSSGLKDMIGKVPDMAMNLFDWAGVVVKEDPETKKGVRRSIWDAWLGTVEQPLKNLVTGEPVKADATDPANKVIEIGGIRYKKVEKEEYTRLGDLNFRSMERNFHGTFSIMQWLMGNAERPTGVFIDAMKTDFRPEDFSLVEWKKRNKYVQIIMNPVVMTKGSMHLYDQPEKAVDTLARSFLINLMAARVNSASFTENILNQTIPLTSPNGGEPLRVPAVKLFKLFFDEAMKENPVDEKTLIEHYIDENYKMRGVGITTHDLNNVLESIKFDDRVGKVTGKSRTTTSS